ncbi:MAG: hypothetical protein ACXVPU_15775 [Bacteroidia bacterium]
MKTVVSFIIIIFVLNSCSSSDNSEVYQKKSDTLILYKHDTINNDLPYACVAGVNNGESSKGELVNCRGMILKNNSRNYKIVSFECQDLLNNKKYHKVKNIGALFSKEIIKLFQYFDCDAKFCFENIKVVGISNDTIIINPVIINVSCEKLRKHLDQ